MENTEEKSGVFAGMGRVRLAAVIVLAAAAAFVAWLLLRDEVGGDEPPPPKTVEAATVGELQALPGEAGHPVYWAGARRGFSYELTKTRDGEIYIRYLPAGVAIGDRRPDFLTVVTYPYAQALAFARSQARRAGAFRRTIAGKGIAYAFPGDRKSVYFTYPRLDYLYEVYDPRPLRARRLVLSGRVRPLG